MTPIRNVARGGVIEVLPEDYLLGDIDEDGTVTVADAILAMRYTIGMIDLSSKQKLAGDANRDGSIDVADALLIMRHALGIITLQ